MGWLSLALACTLGSGGQAMKTNEALSLAEIAQNEAARQWSLPPQEIHASPSAQPLPEGLTLVRVRQKTAERSRRTPKSSVGLVNNGRFLMSWTDCTQALLKAWNYGAHRTVSAEEFATVTDQFHNRFADSPVVLENPNSEQFPLLVPPLETEVDGLPAVVYWVNSTPEIGNYGRQYSRLTVIVGEDHEPILRTERYHDIAEP